MGERRTIVMDRNDTVAAAQILAWISRPHRPESAVKILNHWFWVYQRKLGAELPDIPFELMKANRVEMQFRKLEIDCLEAAQAGLWFQWAVLKAPPHPWFAGFERGIRNLASDDPNASLTAALESAPPHLVPIIEAVRDHRVGMLFVPQSVDPFRLPADMDRPTIVLVGDDFDRAVGPQGFHLPSVRRAIRACHAFAVVSSAPAPFVYATMAATVAGGRRNAMLIETRPGQEIQWIQLIQKIAPRRFVWLSTVEGAMHDGGRRDSK